jgi:serine protease Do
VYNNLIGPEHKVVRGSIGISFQPGLSSAVGRMYGFTNGVLVSQVTPNGGAAKAGLQPGDVIVTVDDQKIKDGDDLVGIISARKVGSSVKIGYMRNGKLQTANVVIGDRSKTYAEMSAGGENDENAAPQEADAGQTTLSITVEAIPQPLQQRTGIKNGVVVTSVKPGSFAEDVGLVKGYIITEINKKPVTDKASYNAIVSALKSKDDVVFVVHNPNLKNAGNSYVGGTLP